MRKTNRRDETSERRRPAGPLCCDRLVHLDASAPRTKMVAVQGASSTDGCTTGKLTVMDANTSNVIVEGLISYLGLIILLTFHEFGHAWVALKCGDDTARLQGRVSLNPIVHIDPIGTILLPLFMIFGPFERLPVCSWLGETSAGEHL